MPLGKEDKSGPLAVAVAAEVRAAMGRARVSGNQLSKLTGMSQNYIATRLRDEAAFTITDIEKICAALGEKDYRVLFNAAIDRLQAEQGQD
ncbi:helix-turn-helix domain-containing protein [Paenarthrobacter ilicis]|uniref:helix-turn-helix domain-containing protein n=1 Tax=Paenarthrobacter ilicis TaxID=43665 RepID=UPI0028D05473|nr:helix-turn-helix domain-containing protein [Paenarthrobacter ilicis]